MENNNIDNNMSAFQNVSPEMINMGFSAGQEMLNKQKERWLPGLSNFWLSLKLYFSVCLSRVILHHPFDQLFCLPDLGKQ